jgi:arabinan endo-1,5-alpha-L-arabinosidase
MEKQLNLKEKKTKCFQKMIVTAITIIFGVTNIYCQAPSHDPSRMIKNTDGRYWIFTTGDGIWCMSASSTSFSDWRAETTPYTKTNWPSWINSYVTGFSGTFWAPDVVKVGSYYYLYYSCAGTGAAAAIGVTRATNLSGPWTDQGMVYAGNNAIDPGIYYDGTNMWMVWGNWVEGIDICQLNPSTGKRLNTTKTKLVTGEVEGPALLKNGSYYYLFYQRGLCCQGLNSTYYIVVARSTSITGPYSGERTFIPNKNGRYVGPGHIGYGEGKLTYHYYDAQNNGAAKLMITTISWGSDGWPIAGSPVSGGTYRITPRHSGKALDVANCGTANGTNVQQWSWLNNTCQQWILTDAGNYVWRITPANATGSALDVTSCGTADNTNVQIWSWLNNDCQKWNIIEMGSGYYQLKSVSSGKCLNISGSSTADGANAIIYTCGTATNMQFSLTRIKSTEAEEEITSINEINKTPEIKIYPNPSSNGIININLSKANIEGDLLVNIYDLQGRVLYSQIYEPQELINIKTNLISGSYILSVKHSKGNEIQKVMIK